MFIFMSWRRSLGGGGWAFKYTSPPPPQQLALALGGVTTPRPALGVMSWGGQAGHVCISVIITNSETAS